jgi:hypothetical protein
MLGAVRSDEARANSLPGGFSLRDAQDQCRRQLLNGVLFVETLERLSVSPELRTGILPAFSRIYNFLHFRDEDIVARRAGRGRQGDCVSDTLRRSRVRSRVRVAGAIARQRPCHVGQCDVRVAALFGP